MRTILFCLLLLTTTTCLAQRPGEVMRFVSMRSVSPVLFSMLWAGPVIYGDENLNAGQNQSGQSGAGYGSRGR